VLRISIVEAADGLVTLHLEGKVSGRWVKCLETSCESEMKRCAQVVIDVGGVSFLDRDGMALLMSLADCGVEVVNPSPFIREMMKHSAPL
jgi:ABC-type transporter Mla MlaB component